MRIYLSGFMGAGKTTVGAQLAEDLGWRFVDLDQEIENQTGHTVREIFEQLGELRFRQLETEALRRTVGLDPVVVATGGGTVTIAENRQLMQEVGLSLWLNPPLQTILARIGAQGKRDRPLFQEETQATRLFRERLPAYQGCDVRVDVSAEEQPREVAGRIALLLRERHCAI